LDAQDKIEMAPNGEMVDVEEVTSIAQRQLRQAAQDLARSHSVSWPRRRHFPLTERLHNQMSYLGKAYRTFIDAPAPDDVTVAHAAEWLLDNFYLVQAANRQVEEDLPAGYYLELPELETTELAGMPRIYAFCLAFVRFFHLKFEADQLETFVQAYQEVRSLTMGELWAVPIMLRLACIDFLAQAVQRIAPLPQEQPASRLDEAPPVTLTDAWTTVDVIAHCISNLRLISVFDWKAFFEATSQVEVALRADPAGVYGRMEFDSRDQYRHVVEELAMATGLKEVEVAQAAVQLAQQRLRRDGLELARAIHVGYFLVDSGRAELEAAIIFRPSGKERLRRFLATHAATLYIGSILLLAALVVAAFLFYATRTGGSAGQLLLVALLALVPALTLATDAVNRLVTGAMAPRKLPKIDYEEGIPETARTAVVIPAMLARPEDVDSLLEQLQLHYLRNPDPNLRFVLLTDFPDAAEQQRPEDDALIERGRSAIAALNRRYGRNGVKPFYFFHRQRLWSESQEVWMGWERKRGKLQEFNRLLLGQNHTSFMVQDADLDELTSIRYVITLDADTVLPPGSAHRLVGSLDHPLNRPVFDPQSGRVTAGYTILQPRTEIEPAQVRQSFFTRIFAGDTGLDLYTLAVSDVYQDLFGEGIFVGKGIYDVAAVERSLEGRIPDNSLLSHDLFEGIHGRAALVTDIVLLEDYPPHYLVHMRRVHRWIRGDWQLLPWLWPRVPAAGGGSLPNPLSAIDRWKIIDNLRRSLIMPGLLALLLLAWLWLPGSIIFWTAVALLSLAVPTVAELVNGAIQLLRDSPARVALRPARLSALRYLVAFVFLPYEALYTLEAISTTLVRLFITRKHLLQWTSSDKTALLFGRDLHPDVAWRQMISAVLLSTVVTLLLLLLRPTAVFVPLLLAWFVSPEVAYQISRPWRAEICPLSEKERQELRNLARRTWFYFEQFVGPEDHWLPPDHFQEWPRGQVAHRTSPTNVGFMLLCTQAAHDFGYIGPRGLALRLKNAFATMERLEQVRGHFLNWYDTRTLKPLPPRYVSTVDSGNLLACLVAVREGLLMIGESSVPHAARPQGLLDTAGVLDELLEEVAELGLSREMSAVRERLDVIKAEILAVQENPAAWYATVTRLADEKWPELKQQLTAFFEEYLQAMKPGVLNNLRAWMERFNHSLETNRREVNHLLPWLPALQNVPAYFSSPEAGPELRQAWQNAIENLPFSVRFGDMEATCRTITQRLQVVSRLLVPDQAPHQRETLEEARLWLGRLAREVGLARETVRALLRVYGGILTQINRYLTEADFHFLYNSQRNVFHIGYNVDAGKLDNNYYDLLASEARIASLIAIGKGDVPRRHWLYLSRPLTLVNGSLTLLSWSATMFEYLMAPLLMRSHPDTLLHQSCQGAVDHQIRYGRERNVPWGISESGYYHFDSNQNYQYKAFGVPGLGYKRGLSDDLVIAPYASLLALAWQPEAVMKNLAHLKQLNMMGVYGLYEAIDFTRSRLPLGKEQAIVQSYMVHHQGMILVNLANYLYNNIMVERFHASPGIASVELLLQERIPHHAPVENPHEDEVPLVIRTSEPQVTFEPWLPPVEAPAPQVHYLSNGRYGVLITSAGAGFSRWETVDLTRWRADTTLEDHGLWIYVQDLDSGAVWSACPQPLPDSSNDQMALFYPHQVNFTRHAQEISLHFEVTVSPEDDVEVRRVTLVNHSDRPRRLRLISYAEVVMAPQLADQRHPAFNKLFIESEFLAQSNALLFRRRPRSAYEAPIYMAHVVVAGENEPMTALYESSREQFLGRGRTARNPQALDANGSGLSRTTGATLDPIMSLAQEVNVAPQGAAQVAFLTLAGYNRHDVEALVARYQNWPAIDHTFTWAALQSDREMHEHGFTVGDIEQYQQLLSALIYPGAALRAAPDRLAANEKGQPGLWPFAISGDYPILLVRINDENELPLLRELLRAHRYWRHRHLRIDLVIVNMRESGYAQETQGLIRRLIQNSKGEAWLNQRGGIFVVQADQLSKADRILLDTAARVLLDGSAGKLSSQVRLLLEPPSRLPAFVPIDAYTIAEASLPPVARPDDLLFDNGYGGFTADGREYAIYLEAGRWTPAPWVNVIANPEFGCLVSEAGSSYTWALNSGENRLTPWNNDPVSDQPGEALYLRDEETGVVWSPTPQPARTDEPYLIRHGAGYTCFDHHSHELKQHLRLFVAGEDPVKVVQLRLENHSERPRRLTATYYVSWVLGPMREEMQQYIIPEYDGENRALLAVNPYNAEFGERVAFLAAGAAVHGLTTDRTEFFERLGRPDRPEALHRIGLSNRVEAGGDPCAAIQVHVDLEPGATTELHFLVGQGADRRQTNDLLRRYREPAAVAAAWQETTRLWDDLLGTIQVETPERAMNLLLNRWLLYQNLSCRIWGRSGFYQSSGAFGFRDQLQDVMAMLHARPEVARQHILRAAAHQFEEGDVLHWWHPPSGRGVRTRITDDLIFLPYVTSYYVEITGDESILDEQAPFLRGDPLKPEEHEVYGHYEQSGETASLYQHCLRAFTRSAATGPHGLPLMGGGDWNDGMNRVGIGGKGESVWLGWFIYTALQRFIPICEKRGDVAMAGRYRQRAAALVEALEKAGWDGGWYRRAYYDDGTPLGSAASDECQIDSLSQSWAVLSGAADADRARQAMQAVKERLVRQQERQILLFTPPFDQTPKDPGYIKGYLPGIRENGGQYTHAALWAIWAFVELGDAGEAEALFRLINPIYLSDTPEKAAHYRLEPYVVAADVYGAPPHVGRGGWNWYTGSAGWMYRLAIEGILGLRRRGRELTLDPCLPAEWPGFEMRYRYGRASYVITVQNPGGVNRGVQEVTLDGRPLPAQVIELVDDGRDHQVRVVMG
jgi:cyclic beta-1,2-glucan synthetase